MTIYEIDIHQDTHTCPASLPGNPIHVFDTRPRLVSITITGSCLTPITIRIGDHTAEIPCSRHEPHDRQCRHCRRQIRVRHTTETVHGYQGPAHRHPLLLVGVAA